MSCKCERNIFINIRISLIFKSFYTGIAKVMRKMMVLITVMDFDFTMLSNVIHSQNFSFFTQSKGINVEM